MTHNRDIKKIFFWIQLHHYSLEVNMKKNNYVKSSYQQISVKEAIELSNNINSEFVFLTGDLPATIVGAEICYIDSPIQRKPSILLYITYEVDGEVNERAMKDWEFWDNHENLNGEILWG